MECTLCCEVRNSGTGCLCCPYTYTDTHNQDIPLVHPQHHASIGDSSSSANLPSSSSSSSSHFLCATCLNSYLAVNVLPKVFEIKANFALIHCPFSGCSQVFHPMELCIVMDTNNRKRYQRILEELMSIGSKGRGTNITKKERNFVEAMGAGRRVSTALVDLLTLRCPTCRQAIDPFPDACAAVLCLCCGSYYCNCCLQAFCSGDAAADKAACHLHASSHHPNSSSTSEQMQEGLIDPFLPHEVIVAGHMNYRRMQVWRVLKMVFLNSPSSSSSSSSSSSRPFRSKKSLHASILNVLLLESELREQAGVTLNDVMQLIQSQPLKEMSTSNDSTATNQLVVSSLSSSSLSSSSSSVGFKLMNCIYSANIEAFRQILNSLPDSSNELEFRCPQSGLTLLALSSSFKMVEISMDLLRKGCSVESLQGPCGRSMLYFITEIGDLNLLQAIKTRYPHINLNKVVTKENDSHRIIHVASRYGHGHIIKWLSDQNVDVNAKDTEYGYTPLHLTCVYDQYFATKVLLSIPSINYMMSDDKGKLGVHIAAERGCMEIVRAYLQHSIDNPPLSIVDVVTANEEWTSLHIAAHFKQPHIVKLLIEHGANVHHRDKNWSYTPILFAMLSGCTQSALDLIDAMDESVYSIRDNLERTVLHLACRENMIEVISVLQKSDFMLQDIEYKLPICYCIEAGSIATLNKLISLSKTSSCSSKSIDQVNSICWRAGDKLWYPVHVAAALDKSDLLFELIHFHHADCKIEDAQGKTALDLAVEFDATASKAVLDFFVADS